MTSPVNQRIYILYYKKVYGTEIFLTALEGLAKIHTAHSDFYTTRKYTHYKVYGTEIFLTALEGLAKIHIAHSDFYATRRYTHYKAYGTKIVLTALEGLAKIHTAHFDWMRKFCPCTSRISRWSCGFFYPCKHGCNRVLRKTF